MVSKIRYFCDLYVSRFHNICDLTKEFEMHAKTVNIINKIQNRLDNELRKFYTFEAQQINYR